MTEPVADLLVELDSVTRTDEKENAFVALPLRKPAVIKSASIPVVPRIVFPLMDESEIH